MRCFIVTPPGFESEAAQEIAEIWGSLLDPSAKPHDLPWPEIETINGGLELDLEPFTAVQLNFFLKTPSRILLRLDEFRVRDFPKLHEKLRRFDLRSWIGEGDVQVEVAARSSRLGHEGRIRETAAAAWNLKLPSESSRRVYLRVSDDVCTVSLDTSGEHLHRRGLHLLRGAAPLRETLAAFCLRQLRQGATAGETAKITLIDPMCGSGTLLSEAANLWRGNFDRPYSFQTFGKIPKLFRQPQFAANYRETPLSPFKELVGFDIDEKMVEISVKNTESLIQKPRIEVADLLDGKKTEHAGSTTWVICNPPYGERLEAPPIKAMVNAITSKWHPERLGLLVPEKAARSVRADGMTLLSETEVKNGGLPCRFIVLRRT